MKVLQVNIVANQESTGKITNSIHNNLLAAGADSVVCYGSGVTIKEKNYFRICSEYERKLYSLMGKLSGFLYGVGYFSTLRLISIIKTEKPDVVHLQCVNGGMANIYKLLRFLSANNIATVITLHAEFMYTGTCSHAFQCEQWKYGCSHCLIWKKLTKSLINRTAKSWELMNKAFANFDSNFLRIVAVSPWLQHRAEQSAILSRFPVLTILNGIDTSIFHLVRDKGEPIISSKIILFVSASFSMDKSDIKGGYYVIEMAKRLPQYQFVIVATYIKDTINLPENVKIHGRTKDQYELARLYSQASLTLLTSKRETFSMVTAESLCCGTPVIGFKAGGPESIAIPEYSDFVEYGDINMLYQIIGNWMEKDYDSLVISKEAVNKYSQESMFKNYIRIYNSLKK